MIWRTEREKRLRLVRKGMLLPITPEECRVVESRIANQETPLAETRHVSIAPSKPLPPRIRRSEVFVNALLESINTPINASALVARDLVNQMTNAASGQNPDTKPDDKGTYSGKSSTYRSGRG